MSLPHVQFPFGGLIPEAKTNCVFPAHLRGAPDREFIYVASGNDRANVGAGPQSATPLDEGLPPDWIPGRSGEGRVAWGG